VLRQYPDEVHDFGQAIAGHPRRINYPGNTQRFLSREGQIEEKNTLAFRQIDPYFGAGTSLSFEDVQRGNAVSLSLLEKSSGIFAFANPFLERK
jgi:hypothetical protein